MSLILPNLTYLSRKNFSIHYLLSFSNTLQIKERRKDLIDHRDDSTFSFDPTNLSIKQLNKHSKKHIDTRKGLLLASYGRKKTRKRKKGNEKPKGNNSSGNNNTNNVKFDHWLLS